MEKPDREGIEKAREILTRLNDNHLISQNYIDINSFNELIAKTFRLQRVHLHPKGRVATFIGRYSVKIDGVEVFVFLMEDFLGYRSVGMCVGKQGIWVNEMYKNICRGAAN